MTPFGCPAGIYHDDPQAGVGRHADQQVTELARWHPRYDAAEALTSPTAAEGLPPNLAGVHEVQVVDRYDLAAVPIGETVHLSDRCPKVAVACTGREPVEFQRDGTRCADG